MRIAQLRQTADGRPELQLVAAFAVMTAVSLIIFKLASEIAEGETLAADRAVLLWFRSASQNSGHERLLRTVMLDITAAGSGTVLILAVILACGMLASLRRFGTAALLAIQIALGTSLVSSAKLSFARARPDVVPYFTSVSTASYPSGHAANSAIVYLSIAILIATAAPSRVARMFIPCAAMMLTVFIGLSRLYLGVHWPSDVVAGWAIGGGWALAAGLIARWLRTRQTRL